MANQKSVVQQSLFVAAQRGMHLETAAVIDEALGRDRQFHGGQVFHASRTPRNSVRRTLTDLQADGFVIKDGRGHLRVKLDALIDCVVHGDVLDLLRLLPDGCLPVVHADPPWSYMAEHTSKGTTTRLLGSGMRWFEAGDLPDEVIHEIHRVLRPNGTFLCWFPPFQDAAEKQWDALGAIRRTGFRSLREVTWDKESKGGGYGWPPQGEPCFVFYKQERPKFHDLTVTNIIRHPRLRPDEKTRYSDFTRADAEAWAAALAKYGNAREIPDDVRATLKEEHHGCEKPVGVMAALLRPLLGPGNQGQAAEGDNIVLDLYSGTAPVSLAALELGGHFIAVEKDARNIDHLIVPRLGAASRATIAITEASP